MASASPTSRGAKLAGIAVAAVLVGLFAWQTWNTITSRPEISPAPTAAPAGPAGGRFGISRTSVAAPPFDLVALDGSRFSLAGARGQVVFVNFWATWCAPCREEMPSMVRLGQELMARYPGQFRMVAVSVDDGVAPVKEYFSTAPFAGPPPGLTVALDDEQQAVTKAYYCAARGFCPDLKFPETYIVDKTGRLVAYVVGPRDWSDPAAKAFLEELIRS
jgi:thiol-disulfide isomerase/thioredoxin